MGLTCAVQAHRDAFYAPLEKARDVSFVQEVAVRHHSKREPALLYALENDVELGVAQRLSSCDDEQWFRVGKVVGHVVDKVKPVIGLQLRGCGSTAAIRTAVKTFEVAFLGDFQKQVAKRMHNSFQAAVGRVEQLSQVDLGEFSRHFLFLLIQRDFTILELGTPLDGTVCEIASILRAIHIFKPHKLTTITF